MSDGKALDGDKLVPRRWLPTKKGRTLSSTQTKRSHCFPNPVFEVGGWMSLPRLFQSGFQDLHGELRACRHRRAKIFSCLFIWRSKGEGEGTSTWEMRDDEREGRERDEVVSNHERIVEVRTTRFNCRKLRQMNGLAIIIPTLPSPRDFILTKTS